MSSLTDLSQALSQLVAERSCAVVELIGARVPATATLWSSEGLAVTVAHAMGANDEGKVRLASGEVVRARVRGRDPSSDLALLELELPDGTDASAWLPPRPPAEAGPSVGELVVLLGQHGGGVQANLGMLSRVGGAWRTRLGGSISAHWEVDATLPRGSSGGPLLDAEGRLLGINTHGLLRGGTTIPASDVDRIVKALETHGDRRPGFLGVRFSSARVSDHPTRERALLIMAVGDESPAAKAGIRVGDQILNVEGQAIQRGDDLLAALSARADQPTAVQLWRGGAELEVEVTPVARRMGHRGRGRARAKQGGHRHSSGHEH